MKSLKKLLAITLLATAPAISQAEGTQQELSQALFLTAHIGHMPSAIQLVQEGADVNYIDKARQTPLHAASSHGHMRIVHFLHSKGAVLNPRTVDNWIPLHSAVRFGHTDVANYLLTNGAPLNVKTKTGQTVFDIARATRNSGMTNLLETWRSRRQ